MKYLKPGKGCTRADQVRNENIQKELGIFSINGKISEYRDKWKIHLQ
jgi:hypothetical protein